jgi:hypothetical protein
MADQEAEITEDQATEALHQAMGVEAEVDPTAEPAAVPEPAEEAAEQPAEVTDTGTAAESAEVVESEGTPAEGEPEKAVDDVESLKARLEERDKQLEEINKRHEARLTAMKQRSEQNESVMRDKVLRKSTLVDRARQILKQSRTAEGVPEAEVDRVLGEIDSSMNPASPSYAPPQPQTYDTEDQTVELNNFLNEKGMDSAEADAFGTWIKTEAGTVMSEQEQQVAQKSLGGFLRLAHVSWQAGIREKAAKDEAKRSSAVQAVRSVKRTQREAARAASPVTAAPKKQPTDSQAKEPDYDSFTPQDISGLIQEAVRQYK